MRPERPTAAPVAGTEVTRILVNMERWRWMPEHLGEFHIEDNLPEFMARVYKKGQVIHSARIVRISFWLSKGTSFNAPVTLLFFLNSQRRSPPLFS